MKKIILTTLIVVVVIAALGIAANSLDLMGTLRRMHGH
jgi:hypothetical protein